MTCADCESPAAWVFDDAGALAVPYCDRHLPGFLRQRASAGTLTKAAKQPLPPVLEQPEPGELPPPLEEKKRKRAKDAGPEDPGQAGPPSP